MCGRVCAGVYKPNAEPRTLQNPGRWNRSIGKGQMLTNAYFLLFGSPWIWRPLNSQVGHAQAVRQRRPHHKLDRPQKRQGRLTRGQDTPQRPTRESRAQPSCVSWPVLDLAGMSWAERNRNESDGSGQSWTELCLAGLNWTALGCTELDWPALVWTEVGWG